MPPKIEHSLLRSLNSDGNDLSSQILANSVTVLTVFYMGCDYHFFSCSIRNIPLSRSSGNRKLHLQ